MKTKGTSLFFGSESKKKKKMEIPKWKKRQYVEWRLGIRDSVSFTITEEELKFLHMAYSAYEFALLRDKKYYAIHIHEALPSVEQRLDALFGYPTERKTKWKRWKDKNGKWHFELR